MDNANKTSFTMPIRDLERTDYGFNDLKYLIELGATCEESHHERYDKHFVIVSLPEGFTIGESFASGNFKYRIIFDANGNKRGTFLVKADNWKVSNLVMAKKFRVLSVIDTIGDLKFERVCFGNDDVILFEEGRVAKNNRHNSELYVQSKLATLKKDCEAHADLFYPEWRNPLAYWDEEPMIADEQMLARIKED